MYFKKYLAAAKIGYLRTIEKKSMVYLAHLQSVVTLLVLYFFWKTVYSGRETLNGYTFSQMITFYFLVRVTYSRLNARWGQHFAQTIKTGEVSNDIIKPVNFILFNIFRYEAVEIVWLFLGAFGVLITMLPLLKVLTPPHSFWSFIAFFFIFFANGILAALINLMIGFIAFWTTEIAHFKLFATQVLSLLSGGLVPLTFYPEKAQKIINLLPFKYLVQFPIDVYFGKVTVAEFIINSALLIGWIICLWIFADYIFKKALRAYESYN